MARPDFRARYGSWALVAGASEGLGAEFAYQIAARGLNLVLVARRQELLDKLSTEIAQKHAVEVRTLPLDLARTDTSDLIIEATRDLEIGLLVYNAAAVAIGSYLQISLEDHRREIAVNCRMPMELAHILGQTMIKRQRGGIILLSSMSASQGTPLVANYGATKAYNLVLAEGLWAELRSQGVDVLASLPAPVNTPRYQATTPGGSLLALTPRLVVSDALDSLGKGPGTIPGWTYRLAGIVMQRLIPRKTAIGVIGRATRTMYGQKETDKA